MFDDYEADMLSDIDFAINREFTVQVEKGFTEEDIYEIKQNLAQQNQRFVQTGGKDGLDFSDNLIIQEILKDNPKIARYKIQVLVERRKKEAKEYALEQMKLNNQAQQASNQQAQQGQAQLLAMEAQMKKMQQEFEMALEAMKIDKKQQAEAKNIILEHQLNMQNEQYEG